MVHRVCFIASPTRATMVWLVATLLKVKLVTEPTDTPSTRTTSTWNPDSGVMVKVWESPGFTITKPEGEMAP